MLIQYLIKQSRKPSGLVGRLITNIWSSYFKELSLWAIKQTTIPNNSRILEIGYGGGSTIKNLLELDKNLDIHGIDISKESYQTARRVHSDAIENGSVKLRIGNVANLPYQIMILILIWYLPSRHIFLGGFKTEFSGNL